MGLPPLLCRSISTRNSLSDLAPPPPLPPPPRIPCAPLGSKSLLLRRLSNVSTRQPFHFFRRLFLAPSPLFFRGLRTLHRGISIYLLVFKSRLDIQRERYSPFSWIRNFNYEMPRSRSSKRNRLSQRKLYPFQYFLFLSYICRNFSIDIVKSINSNWSSNVWDLVSEAFLSIITQSLLPFKRIFKRSSSKRLFYKIFSLLSTYRET